MPLLLRNAFFFAFMAALLYASYRVASRVEPLYDEVLSANVQVNTTNGKRYIYVRSRYTFKDLKKYLHQQHILADTGSFSRFARKLGYHKGIIPGRYQVKDGMTNRALLDILMEGRQDEVTLPLADIRFKEQFIYHCSQNLEADEKELTRLLKDKDFLAAYNCTPQNVLAHIFGETYELKWNTSARELLTLLLEDYRSYWTAERKQQAATLDLSAIEIMTLASIVEEEVLRKDEAPKVAGVYLNRLRKDMRLQADPTLKYALLKQNPNKVIKRLYQANFKLASPYNTYRHTGLPPGPIVLPPKWAVDAVLSAESHNYIYFVAKADFSGYHHFSATYEEHTAYSKQYQAELNRRGIY